MNLLSAFRLVLGIIIFTHLNFSGPEAQAQDWEYWIQKPNGWTDNKARPVNQPIRQFIAPEQKAFIENYTIEGQNPGIHVIADRWEEQYAKGLPFSQVRLSNRRVNVHPAPGIIREYRGDNNGVCVPCGPDEIA